MPELGDEEEYVQLGQLEIFILVNIKFYVGRNLEVRDTKH